MRCCSGDEIPTEYAGKFTIAFRNHEIMKERRTVVHSTSTSNLRLLEISGYILRDCVRFSGKDASEYWNEIHAHVKEDILEDLIEGEGTMTGLVRS